jgi:APA family basic amino acid/polyamine antiporter
MAPATAAIQSLAAQAGAGVRRGIGSPVLFMLVYTSVAAALYFSLGVIADHALGLTPFVFLAAGLFFVVTLMTYVEAASLHQERAGSTVFARYAFNELVSFVTGWAVLLDYLIVIALCAFTATNYAATLWAPIGRGTLELVVAIAVVVYVAFANVLGLSAARLRRGIAITVVDLALQIMVIVVGLIVVFNFGDLMDTIDLGRVPEWDEVVFALAIAAAAFTGLEASSGLAGEVAIGRRGLRRLVVARAVTVPILTVGIALVAMTALPADPSGHTELGGRFVEAPVVGVVGAYDTAGWFSDALRYMVAVVATMVLIAAANAAMLGLSRLAYSLSTNRQIPSAIGRLHPRRSTPYVTISIATVLATALVAVQDIEDLIGIFAFGAMLAFTIAHLSVIVLRFREPERDRPYTIPFNIPVGKASVPLPAVLGTLLSGAGFISILALHSGARIVGVLWMAFGVLLYVVYRVSEDKPLLKRVVIEEEALRTEPRRAEYGSILVPIFGTPLDDDIIQTAGRLAAAEREGATAASQDDKAVIEAIWIFEVPMSLPLEAALPDAQLRHARDMLKRAKSVGEEYEDVFVATATVRARRAGQAIVEQARRRGVEAIVLAAEEPTRIRGGALLGGTGGPLDSYLGDVTRYVINKAPCRVILTAPPAGEQALSTAEHAVEGPVEERPDQSVSAAPPLAKEAKQPPESR